MGIRKLGAHGVSWPMVAMVTMVAMVALPNYDDNGRHRFSHVIGEGVGFRNYKLEYLVMGENPFFLLIAAIVLKLLMIGRS